MSFATEHNHVRDDGTTEFWPYLRDPETLARLEGESLVNDATGLVAFRVAAGVVQP